MKVICTECSREYVYDKKIRGGHTRTVCNSCMANRKRFKRKQKCLNYLGGSCSICGYNKCEAALEFHHENNKNENVSQLVQQNKLKAAKDEIKKCTPLCANCHRIRHEYEEITNNVIPK